QLTLSSRHLFDRLSNVRRCCQNSISWWYPARRGRKIAACVSREKRNWGKTRLIACQTPRWPTKSAAAGLRTGDLDDDVECHIDIGFRHVERACLKPYDELSVDFRLRQIDAPIVVDRVDQSKVVLIKIRDIRRFVPERKE